MQKGCVDVIEELKILTEKVALYQKTLRCLYETVSWGIVQYSLEPMPKVVYANKAAQVICDWNKDGRLDDPIYVEDRLYFMRLLTGFLAERKKSNWECRVLNREGEQRWINGTVDLAPGPNGEAVMQFSFADVTLQKKKENSGEEAENILRNYEQYRKHVTMQLRRAIFAMEIDLTKDIIVIGQGKFPEMTGSILGTGFSNFCTYVSDNLVCNEDRDFFSKMLNRENLLQAISNGHSEVRFEYRGLLAGNKYNAFRIIVTFLVEPVSGRQQGFLRLQNIQEEKQTELNLRKETAAKIKS